MTGKVGVLDGGTMVVGGVRGMDMDIGTIEGLEGHPGLKFRLS